VERTPEEQAIFGLLRDQPGPLDGLAARLGIQGVWTKEDAVAEGGTAETAGEAALPGAEPAVERSPAGDLIAAHPEALRALAARLGIS